ncbi:unnamed protein product [Parnassius apollo]|uniref:(apollo) hypothetical protein n=1 Tax=Parnassius apollo TaxID=110799 RepID=A0A8S3X5Y8_PARAO|nr:unnamed protein product [Parnassius apollo]
MPLENRPRLPRIPLSKRNRAVVRALNPMLVTYLEASRDLCETDSVLFGAAVAACRIIGAKLPMAGRATKQSSAIPAWRKRIEDRIAKGKGPYRQTDKLQVGVIRRGSTNHWSDQRYVERAQEPHQANTVAFWRSLWSEPVNHSEGPWTEVVANRVRYILRSNIFDVAELERLRREAVPSSDENATAEDAAPQMIEQLANVDAVVNTPVVVDSNNDGTVAQELN